MRHLTNNKKEMKKIMFNDKYGLTTAVLEGRKTMTRRISEDQIRNSVFCKSGYESIHGHEIKPKYEVGEIVAIAQSYRDSGYTPDSLDRHPKDLSVRGLMKDSAGWNNKMFVKSYACKHHIKITNVKIERLQDISDEDCLKEGIVRQEVISDESPFLYAYDAFLDGDNKYFASRWFRSPKEAFAVLIDKVSGKGVFQSNPFVFAYEFVLFD